MAEGLYNFNFHYCQNMVPETNLPYSFTVSRVCVFTGSTCLPGCTHVLTLMFPLQVELTERNPGGYLSAAEIPLSRLYICMAGVFFTAAMVWVFTLMKHRYKCTWHEVSQAWMLGVVRGVVYLFRRTLTCVWCSCCGVVKYASTRVCNKNKGVTLLLEDTKWRRHIKDTLWSFCMLLWLSCYILKKCNVASPKRWVWTANTSDKNLII